MMKETVYQFGPNNSLTGILSQPDESVRVADAPVALILNAGIVHSICLLYTSPSPRDRQKSRMPSSA